MKIWHNSDISKNRTLPLKLMARPSRTDGKTRRKLVMEAAKRPAATLKRIAAITGKHWLLPTCDTQSPKFFMSQLQGRVA